MIKVTILKTASYAMMHMTIAITIAYLLSGSWSVAFAIGLVEPCAQTCAFFFHERFWHKIENKMHKSDYHDSVIDSVSPAGHTVETFLRNKE